MTNFKSQITSFDLQNALLLGEASQLAYKSRVKIKEEVRRKWGLEKYWFMSRKHTQLFVAGDNEFIMVAFRGTEPNRIEDWLTDLDVKLVKGPLGLVHRGFLEALNCVWKDLRRVLKKFQNNGQTLWLAGHSLGGALAMLATAKFLEEGKEVNGLYTFGQPRVGDKKFSEKFDVLFRTRTHRFTNNNDIITRNPPRKMKYYHAGLSKYFDFSGNLHHDIGTWRKFLDSLAGMAEKAIDRFEELQKVMADMALDWVQDHSMDSYIRNLERLIQGKTKEIKTTRT